MAVKPGFRTRTARGTPIARDHIRSATGKCPARGTDRRPRTPLSVHVPPCFTMNTPPSCYGVHRGDHRPLLSGKLEYTPPYS